MRKLRSPLAAVIIAVIAAAAVLVGVAAVGALNAAATDGELLESFETGGLRAEVYGAKPALAPSGFLRIRVVSISADGEATELLSRTCSFETDDDGTIVPDGCFDFTADGDSAVLIIHDTHGDIHVDIDR